MLESNPSGISASEGAALCVALFYAPFETGSDKLQGQGAEPLGV